MQRLILARHGESDYSARGLVNGDPALAVRLTPRGRAEARRLGERLAREPIGICAVTELGRTLETAELALAGRGVPLLRVAELNDPLVGRFEGLHLDEYRAWAWAAGSAQEAPAGGESRLAVTGRYVLGFRRLLERPEAVVLAVLHALPIAYLLAGSEGRPPAPRMDRRVEHAVPHELDRAGVERALAVLEAWRAAPTW